MAGFNIQYFWAAAHGGGRNNTIWHYNDQVDNIASLVAGAVNAIYFKRAFTDHGIIGRRGDVIMATYSYNTSGINKASTVLFTVPLDWDANGATIVAPFDHV